MNLFDLRKIRQPVSLYKRSMELKAKNGAANTEMTNKDLFIFIDSLFKLDSTTFLLDGKYFAKYIPEAGFKFAIDAIHNIPNSNPYICTYTLNPPGDYYLDKEKSDDLKLVANIDWNHPVG